MLFVLLLMAMLHQISSMPPSTALHNKLDKDITDPSVIRVVRSVLTRRRQCTVSTDKIEQLNTIIKESLTKMSATSRPATLCVLNQQSDNCEQLVETLQCGINHLRNRLIELLVGGDSLKDYDGLKAAMEELQRRYNRVIDDVRTSVSQEYESRIRAVQDDLQTLLDRTEDPRNTLCQVTDCMVVPYRGARVIVCRPLHCVKLSDD